MKNLYILGSCGSIGTQTLDIVRKNPNEFRVIGMSLGSNLELARSLVEEFKPEIICFRKEEHKLELSYSPIVTYGDNGLLEIARYSKYSNEWLVNALVGISGLMPTVEAIKNHKDIALANKETLVVAGDIINKLIKEYNVSLLPIDSEHSAILQCIIGEKHQDIDRLIITASGGSFRDLSKAELEHVSVSDALKHPNWSMGPKITIDSATMMNKGFEVIEAHYLFNIDYNKIDTVLHRGSIVHSMVMFNDGSIKAQLGISDMRIPISYALFYPRHERIDLPKLNLLNLNLSFEELSKLRYPCLDYAYRALDKGGLYLAVLNASNEAAVYLFLNGKISFLEIEHIIEREITNDIYDRSYIPSLEERVEISKVVYQKILRKYGGLS